MGIFNWFIKLFNKNKEEKSGNSDINEIIDEIIARKRPNRVVDFSDTNELLDEIQTKLSPVDNVISMDMDDTTINSVLDKITEKEPDQNTEPVEPQKKKRGRKKKVD